MRAQTRQRRNSNAQSKKKRRVTSGRLQKKRFQNRRGISADKTEMRQWSVIADPAAYVKARVEAKLAEREAPQELAAELAAMKRLYEFGTRFLAQTELQPILEEVLEATIALVHADFGNVQLYDLLAGRLKIVAQRGFRQDFIDYFNNVEEGAGSCGTALQRGERVMVEDVLTDPIFVPHLKIVTAAGYRAVQSTPLMSRSGKLLGMISTHFRQPHRPSERELRFVDLYARRAAEIIERMRIEEKLRRSEAHLAEGQRLSHTASWAWNVSTGDIFWSEELFRIYGLDPEEARPGYPSVLNYIHPADRLHVQETFEDAVRKKRHYELAYRVVRPDGTIRHVNNIAHPVFNNDGELIEYVGTTIDATERVQSETALRESEARFRRYFELGLIGMGLTSPSKGILEVNDKLCRIWQKPGPS
jgi:PAS domain S-box-containing protein